MTTGYDGFQAKYGTVPYALTKSEINYRYNQWLDEGLPVEVHAVLPTWLNVDAVRRFRSMTEAVLLEYSIVRLTREIQSTSKKDLASKLIRNLSYRNFVKFRNANSYELREVNFRIWLIRERLRYEGLEFQAYAPLPYPIITDRPERFDTEANDFPAVRSSIHKLPNRRRANVLK